MARYPTLQKSRARKLREAQTDVEGKLWSCLRDRQLVSAKFRRQHPIGPFIADFCCVEEKLVVELDGGQHAERVAADKQRTKIIENCGYRVLRFWDSDVASNLEGVLERISESLKHPHPNPLPLRGRGDKRKSKEVRP